MKVIKEFDTFCYASSLCNMLRQQLKSSRLLPRVAWTCRRLRVRATLTVRTHSHDSSWDAVHHEWRIRLFDSGRAARSYAINLGHFPDRWFLGPSASVYFSRQSDKQAGRPDSFRISSRQLEGLKTSGTDLSLGTDLAVEEHFSFKVSDAAFSLFTQAYGAVLSVQSTQAHAERQLSRNKFVLCDDVSHLTTQALRLEMHVPVMHGYCNHILHKQSHLIAGFQYPTPLIILQAIMKKAQLLHMCNIHGATPLCGTG